MSKTNMLIDIAKVEVAVDPGTIPTVVSDWSNIATILTALDALTYTVFARCIDVFANIGPKEVAKVKYSTGEIDSYAELWTDAWFTWAENFNVDVVNKFLDLPSVDVTWEWAYGAIAGNNWDILDLPKVVLRIWTADWKKRIYIAWATVTDVFKFIFDKVTSDKPAWSEVKIDWNNWQVIIKELV